MMAQPPTRPRVDPMKIRLQSGLSPLRFGAMLLAVLMAAISLVGCTPEQVMQAAGHLGVNLTAEQAAAVAEAHTAKHGPTDPTIEVTPEMAKAIAWTAAVHQAEQQAAAALPCRTKGGVTKCPTASQWAKLRNCESGSSGLYRAVSRSGKYRGAYQADKNFWRSYGGDPAYLNPPRWEQAPPEMQDRVAYAGYRARGSNPWPVCGRNLR